MWGRLIQVARYAKQPLSELRSLSKREFSCVEAAVHAMNKLEAEEMSSASKAGEE
jgi:hypothetical protein